MYRNISHSEVTAGPAKCPAVILNLMWHVKSDCYFPVSVHVADHCRQPIQNQRLKELSARMSAPLLYSCLLQAPPLPLANSPVCVTANDALGLTARFHALTNALLRRFGSDLALVQVTSFGAKALSASISRANQQAVQAAVLIEDRLWPYVCSMKGMGHAFAFAN